MNSSLSVLLRCLLLLGKFAFLIYFAKVSSVVNVGSYAILTSSITILVFVLGFEMHAICCRAVASSDSKPERGHIFLNHTLFVAFVGLISILIYFLLRSLGIGAHIEWLNFKVLLLLIAEMYAQEVGRYLLMVERPVASNFVQFMRGGAWPLLVIFVLPSFPVEDHMRIVIDAWLISSVLSIVIGLIYLRREILIVSSLDVPFVRKAFWDARFFWMVAILTQSQIYLDRYILGYFSGLKSVGIVALFQNLTNVIQTFVQVGVVAIILPKLIRAFERNSYNDFVLNVKLMFSRSALLVVVLSVGLVVSIDFVLNLTGKQEYVEYRSVLYFLLVSNGFASFAIIPHIALYSCRADKVLFRLTVMTFVFHLIVCTLLTKFYGLYGSVISMIAFNGFALLLKTLKAREFLRGFEKHEKLSV